ncbi:DMT family transporter [Clostridium sp. AM58-1XD]|uniref:DMT family transporter n=1 Tax=Clostridium sp. AM58-1XD TaxID=2292307 RepID=UPI000E4D7BE1|nr:DMT family transporter [Clostridium sp. AM58-1XD]RGY99071.1 DMT family transporter [Clostridium sp. AM58-1XD]
MNHRYKGIIFIIISAFCFALMNVFVRASGDLPFIQKSFFRNFVAAIFAAAVLMKNRAWFSGKKGNLKILFWRSVFGAVGIMCNFYAVDHLLLADASMLNKMSPFFAIIFSCFILKEHIRPWQAVAVIAAFIGSLLVIKPTVFGMSIFPSFIGLLGGLGAGAAYTLVRLLGERGEKGPFIVFFFSAFTCLLAVPYLILDYHQMTLMQFGSLMMAGLAAAGGQFSITAAYCYAPAKEISIYDYSQIIFSAVLGFLLFGQIPDGFSWAGYMVIIGAAVGMFLYNRRENRRPGTQTRTNAQ